MSGLLFPVVGATRVSSTFGGRSSPGGIGSTNHMGVDIAAPSGSSVLAPTNMRIVSAGSAGGFGNLIQGIDDAGNTYQFGHLSGIGVKAGQSVNAGSVIGAVGSTGNSTGNHLHFGIKDTAGKYIDPVKAGLNIGKDALKSAGNKALAAGKNMAKDALASVAGDALAGAMGGAALGPPGMLAAGAASVLGIGGGGPSLIEELQAWIKKSGFFQRIALAFFAFILIGGAILLLKGDVINTVTKAVK